MPHLVPTCVWKASAELLLQLDERFGEPVDTYVNGSQVWLRDDGPGGVAWRLRGRQEAKAPQQLFGRTRWARLSSGPR